MGRYLRNHILDEKSSKASSNEINDWTIVKKKNV